MKNIEVRVIVGSIYNIYKYYNVQSFVEDSKIYFIKDSEGLRHHFPIYLTIINEIEPLTTEK